MIIGLTGGVGSGKSTVAHILKDEYGAELILSDDVARQLMERGQKAYLRVTEEFGCGILDDKKNIDREKLAGIVFSNKDNLDKLNKLTHPIVIDEIRRMIKLYENDGLKYIVIESAMLVETGCNRMCDEVWAVITDNHIRGDRLLSDRGYTKAKTASVIKNQKDALWYTKNSDIQIKNDSDLSALKNKIREHVARLEDVYGKH